MLRATKDSKYIEFLRIMAEPFVGSREWRKIFRGIGRTVDQALTISSEAFLLLCTENYSSKWIANATGKSEEEQQKLSKVRTSFQPISSSRLSK